MSITQKILLFVSLIVVALVGVSVGYTTIQANRLAHATIHEALGEASGIWSTFQADRFAKLQLGIRALENDASFKASLAEVDYATIFDMLEERTAALQADLLLATDAEGYLLARTDKPGSQGDDLSGNPLIALGLDEAEPAATAWRLDNALYHMVSVPLQYGPEVIGVLMAGYQIDEKVAANIRKLTRSEVAFVSRATGLPPELVVSSLGPREGALSSLLAGPELGTPQAESFEIDLGGERYVGIQIPLMAVSGETVGSLVALRSLAVEMGAFVQFRNSLVLVALVIMGLALALAYLGARRITGPLRLLVTLVEKARDGSYSGAVSVHTSDEIGVLSRAFGSLLADLREKEQMVDFLREGMTMLKRGAGGDTPLAGAVPHEAPTVEMNAVTRPQAKDGQALEVGGLFAGRFEVLGTLGKGGMGVVYRARDRQLDEVVALKVLRPEALQDDPSMLERFKLEIKLARRITHRNVLRTHDFGESDGRPYISMEYLEGVTLKDLVRNKGALPLPVALRVAKQACLGLEAAHEQGVIHRDIKPQNMLILPETGELKIMDFGIARVSEMKGGQAGLTTAGTVMGTPDYMPPEQAQGQPVDYRSDIYSLGVVLFEVFAGQLPFSGDTVMAVVLDHIQKVPPGPRSLNPALPPDVERVILRCLEKDPARRYPQMGALLDDLDSVSAAVSA